MSAPMSPSTATPWTAGSRIRVGASPKAIAIWPNAMTTAVQMRQGQITVESNACRAVAAPNMKPIDKIGPQPVEYATTPITAILTPTLAFRCHCWGDWPHSAAWVKRASAAARTITTYTQYGSGAMRCSHLSKQKATATSGRTNSVGSVTSVRIRVRKVPVIGSSFSDGGSILNSSACEGPSEVQAVEPLVTRLSSGWVIHGRHLRSGSVIRTKTSWDGVPVQPNRSTEG